MYNNYEEYMQTVLGYNIPNTYKEYENNYYYDTVKINSNMQEVNTLYPEIYRIIYPVIQKACSIRTFVSFREEQIDQIVEEVYNVVEAEEEEADTRKTINNSEIKNSRTKETRKPAKQNYLLKDLIKILVIRELLGRRPMPMGFGGNMPGMSMTGQGNMNQIPPIMRPRKS